MATDVVKTEETDVKSDKPKTTPAVKSTPSSVDIKDLFEAGAHFGHKTSRWHPKMAPYIHSERDKNHIIDLTKTVEALNKVLPLVTEVVSQGKQILLVGTKRQARDIVKSAAQEVKMPFVTERWIGGMLTNKATISGQIRHLKDLETKLTSGEIESRYNKLEVQKFNEEVERLNLAYGGIKEMAGLPGMVFVTDVIHDHLAVKEANRLNVPVMAIVDSNCDPTPIDYPIPANDDAIKTLQLITDYVVGAIRSGKAKVKSDK
jgi:small subunit ribosomal protein S2